MYIYICRLSYTLPLQTSYMFLQPYSIADILMKSWLCLREGRLPF